jgi:alpha-galactosidase
MTPEIHDILTNSEVIAVNQDPLGRQGSRVWKDGDLEIWSKQMADGSRAVVLFNRSGAATDIEVKWPQIGYPAGVAAQVRDAWAKRDLGKFTGAFKANVASHGVVMVRVTP